jgi:transcriptional regulator with XRE-family HTH domain
MLPAFSLYFYKVIALGKKIEEVLKDRKMSVADFAKKINTNRNNVYDIFKRKSIDTELLYKISKILSYNFFELFITAKESDKILMEKHVIEQFETQIELGKKRIQALEKELSLVRTSLKDKEVIIALMNKQSLPANKKK